MIARTAKFSATLVTALVLSVSTSIVTPALADDVPSWDDVQRAKSNEASKQAEIDKIVAVAGGLQDAADKAMRDSMIAGEAYNVAMDARDEAAARRDALARQADAAAKKAQSAKSRAGLMVSRLAKVGGGELSINLITSGSSADDVLYQLGTMSKLSEQASAVYTTALTEINTASALGRDAEEASKEYERLAAEAEGKLAAAKASGAAAEKALADNEAKTAALAAQLASLKNTSADAERKYLDAEAAKRKPPEPSGGDSPPPPPSGGNGGGNSGGGGSSGGGDHGGGSGGGDDSGGNAGPPNASAVDRAISFAKGHANERDIYVIGGIGPHRWDCSGLTLKAYSVSGIGIGTHSATNQYNTMRRAGKLAPYSSRRPGDLIFWGIGSADMYHVAIYLGGGMIVEAANEQAGTRIHSVWGSPFGQVGRPSA